MKIIAKKQVRLDELLQEARNENLHDTYKRYRSTCGRYEVRISNTRLDYVLRCEGGHKSIAAYPNLDLEAKFNIEVEEELTEYTELKPGEFLGVTLNDSKKYQVDKWGELGSEGGPHIGGIKEFYDLKTLYKINEDGTLTLIYSEEFGIPTEGRLEL